MTCYIVGNAEPEAFHSDWGASMRQHYIRLPVPRTPVRFHDDTAASALLEGCNLKLQARVAHDSRLQLAPHVLTNVCQSR